MNIIKFLEENKVELFDKLIELELVCIDDVEDGDLSVDDLTFVKGYYEKGDDLIESEEICGVLVGLDLSFKRKFVKDVYGDAWEVEFDVKGKKVFGLSYNV
jgi:hypothetical protein